MENDWNLYFVWIYSQFQIAVIVSRTSEFSGYMTVISDSNVFFIIFFVTNMTTVSFLKFVFIFCFHFQWFIEMLFHRFFAIFDFIKHLLHESVNSFFTSKNLYWFTIFVIITTNQLVPITANFVFLICFCI